mmetsp:Transcript_30642/g.88844  ORF Transcript_30642/g.88844 Transcript_30642/m.88844 type:complete len:245 (-) Transcript_30642:378-1112(-)
MCRRRWQCHPGLAPSTPGRRTCRHSGGPEPRLPTSTAASSATTPHPRSRHPRRRPDPRRPPFPCPSPHPPSSCRRPSRNRRRPSWSPITAAGRGPSEGPSQRVRPLGRGRGQRPRALRRKRSGRCRCTRTRAPIAPPPRTSPDETSPAPSLRGPQGREAPRLRTRTGAEGAVRSPPRPVPACRRAARGKSGGRRWRCTAPPGPIEPRGRWSRGSAATPPSKCNPGGRPTQRTSPPTTTALCLPP